MALPQTWPAEFCQTGLGIGAYTTHLVILSVLFGLSMREEERWHNVREAEREREREMFLRALAAPCSKPREANEFMVRLSTPRFLNQIICLSEYVHLHTRFVLLLWWNSDLVLSASPPNTPCHIRILVCCVTFRGNNSVTQAGYIHSRPSC